MEKQLQFLSHLQQSGSSGLIDFIEIIGIDKAEQKTIIQNLVELKLIRLYKYTICLTVKGQFYLSERQRIVNPYNIPITPKTTSTQTGITWAVKNLKKLSIKNIVEIIIGGLIVGYLIYMFKWNK
jgi:hypothetical protein